MTYPVITSPLPTRITSFSHPIALLSSLLTIQFRLASQITLSEQDKEKVEDLAGKVETILELANEGDNTLSFSSDDSVSALITTSALARGFQGLSAALKKPLDITPIQLGQIGEYFLSHKHASGAEDAYFLLTGLRAVQNSPKAPLALTLEVLLVGEGDWGEISHTIKCRDHPFFPLPEELRDTLKSTWLTFLTPLCPARCILLFISF